MNSEERDVIAGIFKRLEQAAGQPRDAEADRFIAERLREQPYAPYAMAQLIYVQEEAIKSLNQQLEQVRAEAERAQGSGGGGFLSSIFGGGQQRPAAPQGGQQGGAWGRQPQQPGYAPQGYQQGYAPQGGQAGGPWGGQPGMQAPQGRGFLGSALTTAAGVAGGMVVGSALMNAFSGGHSALGSLASPAQAAGGDSSDLGSALWGGDAGNAGGADFGGSDGGFQDASFDDADLGSGGSDDWV